MRPPDASDPDPNPATTDAGRGVPRFAELLCRSHFSFLDGVSSPKELIEQARHLGYTALAITDEASVAGAVRAFEAAREVGLHLICGTQMWVEGFGPSYGGMPPQSAQASEPAAPEGPPPALLTLLAQTRRGWGQMCHWITLARRRASKGQYRALAADAEGRTPGAPMLAGVPECFALLRPQPGQSLAVVYAHAMWMKRWWGAERCALALVLHRGPDDAALQQTVLQVAQWCGLRVVASSDARMHRRSRKALQDAVTAIRLRRSVAECGAALAPNAEAHLRSRARLARWLPSAWMEAAADIAATCSFRLDELAYEYPREIVPEGHTPTSWLRERVMRGAARRYPQGMPEAVTRTVDNELTLIAQLRYEPYFLTVADIVDWARDRDIFCQGRGSAANSAVCYCLHITEVNPAEQVLLFARFLSAERNEPPDIDVDFEHQRREEVVQYVFRKYGRHRAALTAVVSHYRPRSALRDVGRALGVDSERVGQLARGMQWFDGQRVAPERVAAQGFDVTAPQIRLWMQLTQALIGAPRHLSQHPGGFIIARETLAHLVPVECAAMAGRSVIQWDKDDLDTLRLIKVDVLALGMLTAVRGALALLALKQAGAAAQRAWLDGRAEAPKALPLSVIPREHPPVYDMLCRADSIGVFQVESRAQMAMLPRLKPRKFYDLVVEVAIVRPGPIQGRMVHPYLQRRKDPDSVTYPNEELRTALGRTLGVPIFQEQVMQMAIIAAGFTPDEADRLRRGMAAWKRRGGLSEFEAPLIERMVARGYDRDYAERIFSQIEGFGEYGFPESHAASFANLVYFSAWLKWAHPDAFFAALLNAQPMGFYAPAQLVRAARTAGVEVRPVDVLHSHGPCTLEPDAEDAEACAQAGLWEVEDERVEAGPSPAATPPDAPPQPMPDPRATPSTDNHPLHHLPRWPLRLGFNRIHGFDAAAAKRLVAARRAQPFTGVEDLARRAQLDARHLALLAQANALQGLAGNRHQAAWEAAGVDTRATALLQRTRTQEAQAPLLPEPTDAEATAADYRATGLTLGQHPVALLRPLLQAQRVWPAAALKGCRHGQRVRASGIVTHRQRPETAKGVFFLTLEDDTGFVNLIVWPKVAAAQRQALLGATLMTVAGVWQCEEGVHNLIAHQIVDHSHWLVALPRSRDFH